MLTSAVASFTLATGSAYAINIVNAEFELPGPTGLQATGWVGEATQVDHASFPASGNGSLGTYFVYNTDGEAAADQVLGDTFAADTTYTFQGYSVNLGANLALSIGYGGTNVSFIELTTGIYDLSVAAPTGGWELLEGVTYTTGAGGPEIGQDIVVRIAAVAVDTNTTVWFDNVSLDATAAPEPSTITLLGLGGLALIFRRRK